MAFPYEWGCKCSLVIQASKVDSDLTDFPVLLTEDTLPLEMFDADGSYPALNGGGDIRFSSDNGGDTQLACEIVTFSTDNDPANGKAEIWVKIPTISSEVNTTFYIWYSTAGKTQPVSSSTYGSDNVWDTNFKGVWHLNQDPSGAAPQELDSTSNNNDGTSGGSMTSDDLIDGKVGKALDFDNSDDCINCGNDISFQNLSSYTLEFWLNLVNPGSNSGEFFGKCSKDQDNVLDIQIYGGNGGITIVHNRNNDGTFEYVYANDIPAKQWLHYVITYSARTLKTYINGNNDQTVTGWPDPTSHQYYVKLGTWTTTNSLNGVLDEAHISNIARSAAWIKAEYNNQNAPSTFVIEGTPVYIGLYYFSGYVFEQNNPVTRKLYLHNRFTGELVSTTTSSGNGYYYMETTFSGSHYIVCLDDVAGVDYNDLIIGPAFPTVIFG